MHLHCMPFPWLVFNIRLTRKHTKYYLSSKCLLRLRVLRVFVLFCVLGFVRAILPWCPLTLHMYIVYNIVSLNISSIYITVFPLAMWDRLLDITSGTINQLLYVYVSRSLRHFKWCDFVLALSVYNYSFKTH